MFVYFVWIKFLWILFNFLSTIIYGVLYTLGECIALWGEPNELSIQYRIYIFIQYVDS